MRNYRNVRILVCMISLGLMFSCTPSDFKMPAYQADIYVPILDMELSIDDLILADTTEKIREDETGLVSLHYNLNDNKSFEELFPIDNQDENFTFPGISGSIPDFETDLAFGPYILGIEPGTYQSFPPITINSEKTIELEKFIEAEFTSGSISVTICNNYPFALDSGMLIELSNEGENKAFVKLELKEAIDPGQSYTFEKVNIADQKVSGSMIFKITDFTTQEANGIVIQPDHSFDVLINFENIELIKAMFLQSQIDLPAIDINVPFDLPFGALIKQLSIDKGKVLLEAPDMGGNFMFRITFLSSDQNGSHLTVDFNLNLTEIEFDNLHLDLSTIEPYYNILPLRIQLLPNEDVEEFEIEFNKPIEGKVSLIDFDYNYLEGYLGKTEDYLMDDIEIDLFHRVKNGQLFFDDPQIKSIYSNGVGWGGKVRDDGKGLYINGSNERLYGDKVVTIGSSIEGFVLYPATEPDKPGVSVWEINKTNEPNFGEFMALLPTYIEGRIPYQLGTDEINFDQFIDDQSEIKVDMEIVLPLNIAADQLLISDTSDYKIKLDSETFEAKSASLLTQYESYFPLELSFQTYFLDENHQLIDSLFDEMRIIEPAKLSEDGIVIEPLRGELYSEVTYDQITNFKKVSYAVPFIRFNTPEGNFIKLLSSYVFNIKMTGEIATDIDLNK